MRTALSIALATPIILFAVPALGQVDCALTVDKGSTGTGIIQITIDSLFGKESHTDTIQVGVSGGGELTLGPTAPPFSTCGCMRSHPPPPKTRAAQDATKQNKGGYLEINSKRNG